jgi:hypothetical protein
MVMTDRDELSVFDCDCARRRVRTVEGREKAAMENDVGARSFGHVDLLVCSPWRGLVQQTKPPLDL